ncbi:hypothetical protein ACFXD5_05105 [Streptomyces sp. NPDC059385]
MLDLDAPGEVLQAAGRVLDAATVHGARYSDATVTVTEIDTERCGQTG